MRIVGVAAVILAAVPASAGEMKFWRCRSATISLLQWCAASEPCEQSTANEAQARCLSCGGNAEFADQVLVERNPLKGEKFVFHFNCVR
jgi:hypothetical protein